MFATTVSHEISIWLSQPPLSLRDGRGLFWPGERVKWDHPLADCVPTSRLEMQIYKTIKAYLPTLKAENKKKK